MEISNLNNLVRDIKQDDLYNLVVLTFDYTQLNSILLQQHIVSPEEEMRIDLICSNIYQNTNYIDQLLKLNYIDNPLNIMSGDIINYVDISFIDVFLPANNNIQETRNILLNANKSSKKDTNRQQYLESNYSLPPTYLSEPGESVSIEGNQIVIGNVK